jgi:hypothetical protein
LKSKSTQKTCFCYDFTIFFLFLLLISGVSSLRYERFYLNLKIFKFSKFAGETRLDYTKL